MLHGRKKHIAGLATIAVLGIAIAPTAPAQAEPTIEEVQKKVDNLYHDSEVAAERYNDAKLKLKGLRGELKDLKSDERRQDKALNGIQSELRDSMLNQFEGSSMSDVTEVLAADDPKEFLARLNSVSALNDLQSDMVDDFETQVTRLNLRRESTQKRLDAVENTREELADAKKDADGKLAEAEELLDSLEAEQAAELAERAESTSRDSDRTAPVPASGRAGAALDYAMAQVGDAYVWGAAGPDSFDCSGFTMAAWAQAGVSLPHSSSAQYSSGPAVSRDALQPGDLVFYYSPISHVGIYIGNGQIVHASNPSTGVRVDPIDLMPYSGAVRPG